MWSELCVCVCVSVCVCVLLFFYSVLLCTEYNECSVLRGRRAFKNKQSAEISCQASAWAATMCVFVFVFVCVCARAFVL